VTGKARLLAKLQLWLLDGLWQSRVAGVLLIPGEIVFHALAYVNRRRQLKSLIGMPVPVIVVGNINIGGTGKTPMTLELAKIIRSLGYKPGILCRGYGGNSEACLVSSRHSASDVGDEALMLAADFPVAVGRDRVLSAQCLVEFGCDMLLSDDGLQNYRLLRDMEIVMVDAVRGFGNGRCLPAGPLREHISRLRRADYILLRKVKTPNSRLRTILANLKESVPQGYWTLKTCGVRNLKTGRIHQFKKTLLGPNVNAVAGISNPQPFFDSLAKLGLRMHEHVFPDHHEYCMADLDLGNDLPVIMTGKDAVKCRALKGLNLKRFWSLEVQAELEPAFKRQLLRDFKQIRCDVLRLN
jgi:tetraacyldisaccharide 4'-kinase